MGKLHTKRRRLRAGALSVAERSYPTSEVSGGREELPRVQGQWRPGGDIPRPRSGAAAQRSYLVSDLCGGGWEELPRVQGQWRPGEETPHPRSGAAKRSYIAPEARGSDLEEPPRAQGQAPAAGRSHPHPRRGPAAWWSNPRSGGCVGTGGPRGAIPIEGQEQWR